MFVGPSLTMEDRGDFEQMGLARLCSVKISSFLEEVLYLNSFRQVEGKGPYFFLNLLFHNNQLKINLPKAYFLEWQNIGPFTFFISIMFPL